LFGRARSLSLTLAAQIHPDLDSASYVLLQQLSDLGPARAADVVERTGLDKSTVSRQIARLEELALVERVADPSDGRARLVALTESGATRLSRVRADRGGLLRARIADWPTTDIHEFTRLLNRLNSDL
jgi:DNA-binding MarR family transcriptional regulator